MLNLDFMWYYNIFFMCVFWPIVRQFKKKKKKSNEYDDVNEEGIRSIFPVPVLR